MLSEKRIIEEKFEHEIWLYLDDDLPIERIQYWDEQISQNSNLKKILDETKLLFNKSKIDTPELDDSLFEEMIQTSVKPCNNLIRILKHLKEAIATRSTYYKLAFGSILIIVALTVSLIDRNPNPINKISDELLQWDDKNITDGISKVENTLFNRDEQYKEYMKYQLSTDPWKRNITTIEKRINKMKNEIEQTSL